MTAFFQNAFAKVGAWFKKLGLSIANFFKNLPKNLKNLILRFLNAIKNGAIDYAKMFREGDIGVKLSFIIMGFGAFARKQIAKGITYLLIELSLILH